MDYSDFRQASASESFPYGADTVPYILIKGGKITWANSPAGKLALLKERGGKILAVWPGQWSSEYSRSMIASAHAPLSETSPRLRRCPLANTSSRFYQSGKTRARRVA
jgi:hypothetical protein